jgi:hypothetical protein
MTRLTFTKAEREMATQADLYLQMSKSLRAQAMDSALRRKWEREAATP